MIRFKVIYRQSCFFFPHCNSVSSGKLPISCRVPQGSILGPLLFILYIYDLANTSKIFKFILFADDTNIFYSHKDLNHLENIFYKKLCNPSDWFKANKLSLNVSKTNLILFKSREKHSLRR